MFQVSTVSYASPRVSSHCCFPLLRKVIFAFLVSVAFPRKLDNERNFNPFPTQLKTKHTPTVGV